MPNQKNLFAWLTALVIVIGACGGGAPQAIAQNFTIGATPLAPSPVIRGGSSTSTITVTALGGFDQTVILSHDCQAGTTCTFNPPSVTPAGNTVFSTLTVVTSAATPDTSTLTITGTSGPLSRATSLTVSTQAAAMGGQIRPSAAVLRANPRAYNRRTLVNAYRHLNEMYEPAQRDEARSLLRRALQGEDAFEPFAANLDTAAEITDTGTGNVPSATGSLQPQAKGIITWESAHFGSDDTGQTSQKLDFSFGGQFGYAPVYTLVNLTNSAAAALTPKARPMFQQGFIWTIRPQFNIHLPSVVNNALSEELAPFGEIGQTILTSPVTSFKQSNDTITATIVSNNVGNGALFFESGLQYRLYNAKLEDVHRNKGFLNPAFLLESGFKVDNRFKAEGDLAGYDSPRNRAFVRFLVSLNKVGKTLGTDEPKESFSVDFGVTHEIPMSDSRVPASTRIIIRGSLDVMKLLKGQSNQGQNPGN